MEGKPAWSVGPITDAALEPARPDSGASKMETEWFESLKHDGDLLLFWGGAFKTKFETGEKPEPFGMTWHSLSFSGRHGEAHNFVDTPAANIELMLSSLAHEARIRLMQVLYDGPLATSDLTEQTGLKGGTLHYHLKELIYAHYVTQRDGRYRLTHRGYQMLITVACLAKQMVRDAGEEGLVVSGFTAEED